MAEDAVDQVKRAPFPSDPDEFNSDDRISYDQVSQSHKLEDEIGEEWEWLPRPAKWVRVMDAALVEQQQRAYAVEGVDENEPAARKRKAGGDEGESKSKKQKAEKPAATPQENTAIYVTSLPADVDEDEMVEFFSKFGIIAESAETNTPRVKLYKDDDGNFKGDALIVFNKPESVGLAIQMADDSDFRLGQKVPTGPMRVTKADQSFKVQKEQPLKSEQAKIKGTGAHRDRQKAIKKKEEMNRRLADWGDEDDNPSAMTEVSSRFDKIVVMKHMFTLEELAEDAAAYLDIKEDIREECEKFGQVTNVVLYDKEVDGVVTVRFSDKLAAQACVKRNDGRSFDNRKVEAYISDGSEKFMKSRKGDTEGEAERMEKFGKQLDSGEA